MSRSTPLSRNQKLTLALSGVAAFAAIGSLMEIGFQLREMRSGSQDTKKLVGAAVSQADAESKLARSAVEQAERTKDLALGMDVQAKNTEALAVQMKAQAESTSKIAKAAITQAQQAKIAADAATSAANTAQRNLELSERPIITVTPEIVSDLTQGEDGSIGTTVQFTLANSGKTQAVRVFISYSIRMMHSGQWNPREQREQLCKNVTEQGWGYMVFPGQTIKVSAVISAPAEDVKKNLIETGGKFIMPSLSDCITYHSSFGDELYYVRQSYMLQLAVPLGTVPLIPGNTGVKREGLILAPDPLAPGEAN